MNTSGHTDRKKLNIVLQLYRKNDVLYGYCTGAFTSILDLTDKKKKM